MKLSRGLLLLAAFPLALAAPPDRASPGSSAPGARISMGWFVEQDNFTVSDINWKGYNTMAFFTSVITFVCFCLFIILIFQWSAR